MRKLLALAPTLFLLGGCAVYEPVPARPAVVYQQPVYAPAPVAYYQQPVYYAAPAYYGPAYYGPGVNLDLNFGRRGRW